MDVYQTVGPDVEPVSLNEVKDLLKITENDDDSLLISFIYANTTLIELYLNRSLITQTWEQTLDRYPQKDRFKLYNGPIQSVTSITTFDKDNNAVAMSTADYSLSNVKEYPEIVLNYGKNWPYTLVRPFEGVKVIYTAGYGDDPDDVPELIKLTLMNLVAFDYENRGLTNDKSAMLATISIYRVRSI